MANRRFRVRRSGWRSALAVAMTFVLVACGGGSDNGNGNGDTNGGDAPPAQGDAQAIFAEQGCAQCHGEQGEGIGGEPETVVAGTNMIEQQFIVRIRNGRGSAMPGYSADQVSDDEIQLLYEWLKNS